MEINNIDELAKDFLTYFEEEGEDARLSPMQFMKRWHEKGYDIPKGMDLHTILNDLMPAVVARAKELDKREEE